MSDDRVDGRLERGRRTRDHVLAAAVSLASTAGLDGLSLGNLAAQLQVSKSGLFAHWPDKEQLQLAVIDRAVEQWTEYIVRTALAAPAGVRRVFAIHEARLAFYRKQVLPGRCFFYTAQCEFDDRSGPVHDRLAEAQKAWLGFITATVRKAIVLGELDTDVDAAQLAFEIEAIGESVVAQSRLLARGPVYGHARQAILQRLRGCCPDPALLPAR